MALADVHILGSRSGYTTIAAGLGVGADERRELELLQFGELGTSTMAAELASQPMALGRMLSSGRYALSRVCASDTLDDAGRPTIEVVTLVLDRSALGEVAASLSTIVRDNDLWTRVRAQPEAPASIAATRAAAVEIDSAALQLFDSWACAVGSRRVAVVSAEHADAVLGLFALLDPEDRLQCRWGIGMMSPAGAVDLCALRVGGSAAGARETVRPLQPGAFHLPELMAPVAARTRTTRHALLARATAERLSNSVAHDPSWNASSAARQSSGFSWGPRRTAVAMAVLSTLVLGAAIGVTLAKKPATEDVANEDEMVDPLSWGGMGGEAPADKDQGEGTTVAMSAGDASGGRDRYGESRGGADAPTPGSAIPEASADAGIAGEPDAELPGDSGAEGGGAGGPDPAKNPADSGPADAKPAPGAPPAPPQPPVLVPSEVGPAIEAAPPPSELTPSAALASSALPKLRDADRDLRETFLSEKDVTALRPQAWAGWVDARMNRVLQIALEVIQGDRACKANVDASPLWKDPPDDAVEQLESDGGFLFLWNPPKERRSRPSPERVRAWSDLAEQLNEERIVLQRAFKNEGALQEELERRARALAEQTILDERERALLLRAEPWLMLTERRLELERGRIARYLKEATP